MRSGVGIFAKQIELRALMRKIAHRDYRVNEHHQVGAGTQPVDRVHSVRFARVEVGAEGRGKMPAGGEAENADAFLVDVPFFRP